MKLLGKAISGTCGARTYSVGGAGVTARQKVCPVNKNSLAQTRRRGIFAAAGAAFKNLTAEQRAELHARALAAAETDVFGKKITLSDYAFFIREWMRGIRPAPSADPSIAMLDWLRTISYTNPLSSGKNVQFQIRNGNAPTEIQAIATPCGKYFHATTVSGKANYGVAATFINPIIMIIVFKDTFETKLKTLYFRDAVGRVYNFQIQN